MKFSLPILLCITLLPAITSCGDGVDACPDSVVIAFSSPGNNTTLATDDDLTTPGIQTTVTVTSTLAQGDAAILTVGNTSAKSTADADGSITFSNVTLAVGSAALSVSGTSECGTATATADVNVRVPAPSNVSVATLTRQSARIDWEGVGEGGFTIKYDTSPITDENFDATTSSSFSTSVGATIKTLEVEGLRAGTDASPSFLGTSYYFAVAALDTDNNRSLPVGGNVETAVDFVSTAALTPPNAGDGDAKTFGITMASGLFNDDRFYDVAVGAPNVGDRLGEVYVYLGTADGIRTTPNYIIKPDLPPGDTTRPNFGWALTAVHWVNDGSCSNTGESGECHDLAISAPFYERDPAPDGTVFVFNGGARFVDPGDNSQTTILETAAETTISNSVDGGPGFEFGLIGLSLVSARFDNDDQDDLVFSVLVDSVASGGAVVVYGDGTTGDFELYGETGTGTNGPRAHYYPFPLTSVTGDAVTGNDTFGYRITNIGPTIFSTDDIAVVPLARGVDTARRDTVFIWRGGDTHTLPAPGAATTRPFSATRDLAILASDATNAIPFDSSVQLGDAWFGESVGSISDMNSDGVRDIMVTAMRDGDNNEGTVYILDGSRKGDYKTDHVFPSLDPFSLIEIRGTSEFPQFGAAVLNNAAAKTSADVDKDGNEDLVVAGGVFSDNTLYVWYGAGEVLKPNTGQTTVQLLLTSADHTIVAPAPAFNGLLKTSFVDPSPIVLSWAGDVNDDQLEDIYWGMAINGPRDSSDGTFILLYDDGL